MDPKITAVVMIEYQNDFVKSGGAQHELVRGVMESTGMLANSLRLAEESRLAREGHHTHIQAISAYPEIGLTGAAEGPLLTLLGNVDQDRVCESEIEAVSRRWFSQENAFSLYKAADEIYEFVFVPCDKTDLTAFR